MSNFQDLFNLSSDDLVEKEKSGSSDLYKPNAKDGQDGVYKAIVRFIPFWKEPKKSKVKKYQVWLNNPTTNQGFMVDCPSTIGKKSLIADTYWKLAKSTSAADVELSKSFSRKEYYYALVQIVKDKQNPDLEGKIKIFRFGSTIDNKIKGEMEPEFGKPCIPFDLFEGKLFALHITKRGEWNNYENCKFVGESSPIVIDGATPSKDKAGMETIMKHLETNSPDLSKYFYQEWTDETYEKVSEVIRNTVPSGSIVGDVLKSNNAPAAKKPAAPASKPQATPDFDTSGIDDFNLDSIDTTSTAKKDDLDDLYSNL